MQFNKLIIELNSENTSWDFMSPVCYIKGLPFTEYLTVLITWYSPNAVVVGTFESAALNAAYTPILPPSCHWLSLAGPAAAASVMVFMVKNK